MPQKAHLIERENIQISTDKRTREQIAALALAGETTASAVVRAAVNEAYAKKFGRKETVATFTYEQAIRYLCGDPVFQSNDDRRYHRSRMVAGERGRQRQRRVTRLDCYGRLVAL
jgi:hypothetical protein